MKKILTILKTLGSPIVVKSGKGLFLINPTAFDAKVQQELSDLCAIEGIGCIHTVPRNGDETLYVGYVTARTDEDMLSALQAGKS